MGAEMTDWSALFRQFAPGARPDIAAMVIGQADKQFAKWSIITPARQACILGHAFVETNGFKTLEENLNYSAARLQEVWPKRFPTQASAQPYARNPKALANKVYGSRMGNRPGTNDGWDNRGKGLWQCTGRDNCAALGVKLGVSPEVASAWLVDPDHALEAACALFYILGVDKVVEQGVEAQALRINGGKNGLSDRIHAYARVLFLLRK